MNSAIIFVVGTVVFIAVATATFVWGYLQFDALRIVDDRETERADLQRHRSDVAAGADESRARAGRAPAGTPEAKEQSRA
jgi:hypothetical protein